MSQSSGVHTEDHGPQTTIARLPVELLTVIFEAARGEAVKRDLVDACTLGFALGCVSQQFRWTVRQMPAFWRTIVVHSATDRSYRRLLACLSVFPDSEVAVDYSASRFIRAGQTMDALLEDDARFFGALVAEAHRLHQLRFTFLEECEFHLMTEFFQALSVPFLECLTIHAGYHIHMHDTEGNVTETPQVSLFSGGAPALREVHYEGVGFTWASTPTTNLRSMKLYNPCFSTVDSMDDLEELLVTAPILETLHIHGETWTNTFDMVWTPGEPDWDTIVCPSLTELKVCTYTESLLEILKMDMLATLILDGIMAWKLVAFLSQSLSHDGEPPFPHITTLLLQHFNYPDVEQCHVVMNSMPGLTCLSLEDEQGFEGQDNGSLLEAMTIHHSGWAALRTLDTHGVHKDLVLVLLRARQATHPIRTLIVPDSFLTAITKTSATVVDAIRTMGVDFIAKHDPLDLWQIGVQYYSSWSVPARPFLLV
jgi:hypothetical protein